MALGGFSWFQAVPRYSKYGTSKCWLRFDVLIFCAKLYFILTIVQNFNHFDSQPSETLEWRFSKDFCTFTGVYTAIYMGPCRRSYILLVRKFRTSEMLDKWGPTSKLSDIKLSHYPDGRYIFFTCTGIRLSAIPITAVFWYLQIFSLVYYD